MAFPPKSAAQIDKERAEKEEQERHELLEKERKTDGDRAVLEIGERSPEPPDYDTL